MNHALAVFRLPVDVLAVGEDCATVCFLAGLWGEEVAALGATLVGAMRGVRLVNGVRADEKVRHWQLDIEINDCLFLVAFVTTGPEGLGVRALDVQGIGWRVRGLFSDKRRQSLNRSG